MTILGSKASEITPKTPQNRKRFGLESSQNMDQAFRWPERSGGGRGPLGSIWPTFFKIGGFDPKAHLGDMTESIVGTPAVLG